MSRDAKRIAVEEIRAGMYVEALDRPWTETDFVFQGMRVDTTEDIERLRAVCRHVYVSPATLDEPTQPGAEDARRSTFRGADAGRESSSDNAIRERTPRGFREELPRARMLREQARDLITTVHADIESGRTVDVRGAREVVAEMIDSVARHPDALLWFTQIKNRDAYTALHSLNVCMLSITLASALDLDEADVQEMGVGALLHDVGKIRIPLAILNKPGRLTDEEFALMRRHPEYGVDILRDSPDLTPASLEIVLSHHERLDGSGYPNGLAGAQLSTYTQIVAIADVYDAVTSDRVYQKGRTPAEALKLMHGTDDREFNGRMLRVFEQTMGVHPPGSVVELNTGEVGLVLPDSVGAEEPVVLIVLDHRKRRYYPQRVRDLSRFPSFRIARVLQPGTYDIDVDDYAEDMH